MTMWLIRLFASTDNRQKPETPHEEWFATRFGPTIRAVILALQQPSMIQSSSDDGHLPSLPVYNAEASYAPLRQLAEDLRSTCSQHTAQPLSLAQLSPVLAATRASALPMPGVAGALVTIQALDQVVSVLPTKTRPKKLTLLGCNGQRYSYLFKGMEDLHLDERISQFLDVINAMLGRKGDETVCARNYHVIPLGTRSGLIQWVDGATPLYTLYKKWQQREYELARLMAAETAATGAPPRNHDVDTGPPLRPNELFYSKLTPLLKQHGISNIAMRSKWPQEVVP